MKKLLKLAPAALAFAGAVGCNDFLTGGELSTDPNRATTATAQQLFVGVQSYTWALATSEAPRITGVWSQQFQGNTGQYLITQNYGNSEVTTNALNQGLYTGGGLVDARRIQTVAAEARDSLFVGIAQVQEAMIVGTGADLFGDLVYTQALAGTPNPALDPQLAVYDSVQAVLSRAIVNLSSKATTNVGPRTADLVYGGSAAKWSRLAHTLKARYYLHTAEVRPGAYALALAEARQGITDPADNYVAVFSGAALEENLWYQFTVVERENYITPNPFFVNLLRTRNDPRLSQYFSLSGTGNATGLSDERAAADFHQPIVTAQENLLIQAEAAYRSGAAGETEARTALNAAREIAADEAEASGATAAQTASLRAPSAATGTALLREILTEKYIALFQSLEAFNDYKRTCFPNLTPTVSGQKIPARLYYDTSERQTNTSIPAASAQPARNANDPANATDPFGAACLGQ